MNDLEYYSAVERLSGGRHLVIRALQPNDRKGLLAAVDRTSGRSLYRRFFGAKRRFTNKEIDCFLNVDFAMHVALVAVLDEGGQPRIVGGGRYVVTQPGQAEVAFMVVDEYQGQGIGAALLRQLAGIARRCTLSELTAEVLPDNSPMLKMFEKSGLELRTKREAQVIHVTLRISEDLP